jgi:hypothetical protein
MREDYDGAEPSASSMSVMNLLVLSHLLDEPGWSERIDRTFRAFGERLEQLGRAVPMMGAALATHIAGVQQIVVVEGAESGAARDEGGLEQALSRRYLPFAIQLRLTPEQQRRLSGSLPFIAAMTAVDGKTSVYVCRDRACRAPATAVGELEGALAS